MSAPQGIPPPHPLQGGNHWLTYQSKDVVSMQNKIICNDMLLVALHYLNVIFDHTLNVSSPRYPPSPPTPRGNHCVTYQSKDVVSIQNKIICNDMLLVALHYLNVIFDHTLNVSSPGYPPSPPLPRGNHWLTYQSKDVVSMQNKIVCNDMLLVALHYLNVIFDHTLNVSSPGYPPSPPLPRGNHWLTYQSKDVVSMQNKIVCNDMLLVALHYLNVVFDHTLNVSSPGYPRPLPTPSQGKSLVNLPK